MNSPRFTPVDTLIINIDQAVRTVFGRPLITDRADPAQEAPAADLSSTEQRLSARLMRVNHTGEVCAQALYQGQALTARRNQVKQCMEQAAAEENDHLHWCEQRIKDLGSRSSVLNPLFYGASFAIGAASGRLGDRWSLGFLAETEKQVVEHLQDHLQQLPVADHKSRAILETMKDDEAKHADTALEAGAAELPLPMKLLMKAASKIMTNSAYWV